MRKGRLTTLKPRVQPIGPRVATVQSNSDKRIAGYTNQQRRWRLWQKDPHCVDCGRLCDHPSGYELDHEIPLELGGPDIESNLRIRCVWWDEQGRKQGCHEAKTQRERKEAGR